MFQGELDGGVAADVVATSSAGDVKASNAEFDVDAAIAAAPSVVAAASAVVFAASVAMVIATPSVVATTSVAAAFVVAC